MGLDINSVQFLIAARKSGIHFGDVLTLGRQSLNVFPGKMAATLEQHGFPSELFRKASPECAFAEPCFLSLGATKVFALDASDFEGANFVHDLNKPIGPELAQRFDVVYDGGTLEHVFNFLVAIQNCMEMVRVGGRLFIHTCANNLCGHGFYQFSPELFYRTLSSENGFQIERVVVHVIGPYSRWYEVADPNSVRSRVELITFAPIQMLVQAKRTHIVPIFAQPPQQSDYTIRWEQQDGALAPAHLARNPAKSCLARISPSLARLVHVVKMGIEFYRRQSLRNRRFFRPVKKP
jgi:hypothetical protein